MFLCSAYTTIASNGRVAFAVCSDGLIDSIIQPVYGHIGDGHACNATTSYSVVRERCIGVSSCAVLASPNLFGDPVSAAV